jgi:hypothetical protein
MVDRGAGYNKMRALSPTAMIWNYPESDNFSDISDP